MSVSALVAQAAERLERAGVESPGAVARYLASHVLDRPLVLADEFESGQRAEFLQMVARAATGEPPQLITGRMYFRKLELDCVPGVFVVRPETEWVVQAGLDFLTSQPNREPTVVDLCTGSGAIAASMSLELSAAGFRPRVFAVELSEAARNLAARNFAKLSAEVTLIAADATRTIPGIALSSVDLVISNPPYIPNTRQLPPSVERWDPPSALFGGSEDGLAIPTRIVANARALVAPGGCLVMEHDDMQGPALVEVAHGLGFESARTGQDLAGRDRYLLASVVGQ